MSGKWISGPAAFLILVLFFLPWVSVSCNGQPIGELTGYELASGGDNDVAVTADFQLIPSGGNDLALFFFPLAGLFTFGLLALAWFRPNVMGAAGGGQAALAVMGLLILLLEWRQLSSAGEGAFEIEVMPALWGTAVALLLILAGGAVDIWNGLRRRQMTQAGVLHSPSNYGSFVDATPQSTPWSPPVDPVPYIPPQAASPLGMAATDPGSTDVDAVEDWSAGYGATQVDSNEFAAPNLPGGTAPLSQRSLAATAVESEEESQSWNPPPSFVAQEKTPNTLPLAWLVIAEGAKVGEQYRLQQMTRLGRDAGNEIVLADTAVSGHHAQVAYQDGQFHYQDLGSTNGSLFYDNESQQWNTVDHIMLTDGVQLKLGRTVLHFMSVGRANA
ncbi:MAG: FHA domain-containing protein [Ardenticatenaceae bacterium]|nr:FHA domain-containing protein [Anaerolineales bacterium]MCB8923900.1 FHA domain-containing protein [Ardenticatenaceae bacterium]MCB8990455.1 FHA domain-containing protein [Ardenticatenaceae bacterium]MCB9003469.1 FHA domain-containing protein [Ardenticatenaceae bacterium]